GCAVIHLRLGTFGQHRSRHALQGDVQSMAEILDAFVQVDEPGAGGRQAERVDLSQVVKADNLSAGASTGADGLHLYRLDVLAFVDQQQALLKAASADVVERLELQGHALQQVVDAAGRALVVQVQGLQVVGDGAQPGLHLLRLGARQKADVLVQPLHAAGNDDAPVALADHGLLDGGGQRQDGLARAGRAGQVDQVDVRVEQRIQRQGLIDVARLQAAGLQVEQLFLIQVEDQQLVAVDALDPADEALLVEDEFIEVQGRQVVGEPDPMPGAA